MAQVFATPRDFDNYSGLAANMNYSECTNLTRQAESQIIRKLVYYSAEGALVKAMFLCYPLLSCHALVAFVSPLGVSISDRIVVQLAVPIECNESSLCQKGL